jgi:hypothetical protein
MDDMVPLLVLAVLLLAAWAYAVWASDGTTAFMRGWVHVLLVGGVTVLVMGIGAAIRS